MDRAGLRVNGDRLWASLMEMATIGETGLGGCNRQALTDLDRQGRDRFVHWSRAAGCTVTVDQIGNIFARREGSDRTAEPVVAGSHLDTQATGGKFDGVFGVLAGLEVVRTLDDAGIATVRPLEIAVWTNEEGCRFAPAMLGSGVVSGAYSLEAAYEVTDKDGLRLGDELERIGYKGELPAVPRPAAAMYEAHIEQGPILEAEGISIGVVTGIQGAFWFDLTLTGASAHAGPTPMEMRLDPWSAAIPIVAGSFDLARRNGPWGRVTIGDIQAVPGARNTVPASLVLAIDIRHPERERLDSMVAELRALISRCSESTHIAASLDQVWHMAPTRFDEGLIDTIESAATALGYSNMRLVSGAGHDSLHTAQFAPTAMIFVPCAGGLSHNELEAATREDLAAGANVLLHAMMKSAGVAG